VPPAPFDLEAQLASQGRWSGGFLASRPHRAGAGWKMVNELRLSTTAGSSAPGRCAGAGLALAGFSVDSCARDLHGEGIVLVDLTRSPGLGRP